MTLRALYVDFNSYFASVEQQLRPELRGRPIGVLAVMAESTCCIAASVEAKRFGVKTGTPVRDARRLCRNILFVESRPAVYVEMHHRLVAAVESCLPVAQIRSIDEMWCRLEGSDAQRDKALWLAQEIKHAIYCAGGTEMRCSIGIAPNRFLAKTASNMQKPNGLFCIEQTELPQRLFALKLTDLNGIGHAMERRLQRHGIETVEQLCRASAPALRNAWESVEGDAFHRRLHGEDVPEAVEGAPKSIGHSHVLAPALRNKAAAHAVLHRLLQKAALRLRKAGAVASRLCVRVKFTDRQWAAVRWKQDVALHTSANTRELLAALDHAWQFYPAYADDRLCRPMAVGITLAELALAAGRPQALFNDARQTPALDMSIDALNLRFGRNALYFGAAAKALYAAPMRIAFKHVPDPAVEGDRK